MIPATASTAVTDGAGHMAYLCRKNLLLTFHQQAAAHLHEFKASLQSDAWLPAPNIAGLIAAMMIDLSQSVLHKVADLRDSVVALEGLMDRSPDDVKPDGILATQSELLALEAAVSDQLPSLRWLGAIDKGCPPK